MAISPDEVNYWRRRAQDAAAKLRREREARKEAEQQAAEERRLRLMQEDSQNFAYLVLQEQTQVLASELEEIERERDKLQAGLELKGSLPNDDCRRAFIEGAKWWQFHHNGSTMFSSEQDEAEAEANRRYERARRVLGGEHGPQS